MIELMRRIGFPPFKRALRTSTTKSAFRFSAQGSSAEPLEARVLLAADLAAFSTSSHQPSVAVSWLSALSRGGDALLAHAGYAGASGTTASADATNTEIVTSDLIVSDVFVSDLPEVGSTPAIETNANPATTHTSTTSTATSTIPATTVRTLSAVPVVEPNGGLSQTLAASADGPEGETGDVVIEIGLNTFVTYNQLTGTLRVDTNTPITTLEIISKSGIFTGNPAQNLAGQFDIDSDTKIFKLDISGFNSLSFGAVAAPGLTDAFVRSDLTISGSQAGIVGGLSNRDVQIEVFATDLSGNRLSSASSLSFGQEFELHATVKDVRATTLLVNENVGVFTAYFDVTWDPNLAEAVGSPQFTPEFSSGKSGTLTPGSLDEVGAVGGLTPTDDDAHTLFTMRMKAVGEGTLKFDLGLPDILPQHEILVYGGVVGVDGADVILSDRSTVTLTDTPKAPDLVAFAQALTDAGVKFFGAGWCPHCTATKELFQDGQHFLPFIEATNPDRTPNQDGIDNNITSYPTWIFPDNTRAEGELTLATISQRSGVPIPESNRPILIGLEDVDLLATSPLHIPLDGYDPNNGPLTYTVTSSNPNLVAPTLVGGGRNLLVDVNGFGKMNFELFESEVPRVTGQIVTLAEDGFYDGLKFHRILNNFVIQGGDPNGNGTGGSDLPDFNDQFDVDLQHNRTGILSMAKSADDTNNSQFFITEGPTRWLDFNHSIFGQLVEGESNRDNVSNTETELTPQFQNTGVPTIPVTMKSVTVFNDSENNLLRLSAPTGASGTATITVTVADAEGHTKTETFDVNVSADDSNGSPFLADIPTLSTQANTPLTYQLSATDVENDPLVFEASTTDTNITVSVDPATGLLTVTPAANFIGTAKATVKVGQSVATDTQPDTKDSQLITIQVRPAAPTVDLLAASDTGFSTSDNITNAESLQFTVTSVSSGATVEILADGQVIGTAAANGTSVTVTTSNLAALGDGTYEITARQRVGGQDSEESTAILLTYDTTAPTDFLSTAPTTGITGTPVTYDADHVEEGDTGFRYSLSNAPTGATINATNGVLSWTPTANQVGDIQFGIVATDAAGNSRTQDVTVTIDSSVLMSVRLEIVDENGQPLTAVATGQAFKLNVYVQDIRAASNTESRGVFAAYLDVNYPASQIDVNGSIVFGSNYPVGQFGATTTDGLIDDAGATASTEPLGSNEVLLMTIPMISQAAGTATFTADPADESPLKDSLLHGLDNALSATQIAYETATLTIVDQTFAVNDTVSILEDSAAATVRVLDNDIAVPSSATLTVVGVTNPSHGTASVASGGETVLYRPTANYQGADSFTYTMRDSNGNSSTATVTVQVANVNDPPNAADDSFTLAEDTASFPLNVLVNDSFAPDVNEVLIVTAVTNPAHGTATIANDGKQINYTPAANYSGSDTFTYTVSDQNGGTDTATITLTVTEVNDAPVATADRITTNEDEVLTINVSELLANDTVGANETGQTLTLVSIGTPSSGTATLSGNTITFTPSANFFGVALLEYTIRDDGLSNGVSSPQTAVGTVTIAINNVNDPPTAVADTATTQSGAGSIVINVLANDSIAPDTNETLSVTAVSAGSGGGSIVLNSDGTISYTPADGFSGDETFTYTLADNHGGESQGNVTVTVRSFVPGGVTGRIYFDSNGDGVMSSGEQAISGVKVSLNGLSETGQELAMIATTDATGHYAFTEVPPGNYTLTQVSPTFTVDGGAHLEGTTAGVTTSDNSFQITLPSTGIEGNTLNFASRGLEPKFSIWEALASTSSNGFHATVGANGLQWIRFDDGWSDVTVESMTFNASHTAITITIVDGGQTLSTTIARTERTKVQVIGQEGADYLIRIRGSRSEFNFQPVTA